jgi:hypothetical protein
MERLAGDRDLQRALSARTRRAAGALSWDVSARCLADVIDRAAA